MIIIVFMMMMMVIVMIMPTMITDWDYNDDD